MPTLEKRVLHASFFHGRPFRLSCIAFAMTSDAPTGVSFDYAEDATIADVYNGGPTMNQSACVVGKWVHKSRTAEATKDLYFSDEPNGCFIAAMNAGAPISRKQVRCVDWSGTTATAMGVKFRMRNDTHTPLRTKTREHEPRVLVREHRLGVI